MNSARCAGDGLVQATAPSGAIKFTFKDDGQTLNVVATTAQSTQSGSTLTFGYDSASTGTGQRVSCVLEDGGGVQYYGWLVDTSSAPDNGQLSIPLSGVGNGTYTLKIFSEQVNDANESDFASIPVTMTVTVSGGNGTVSGFGGTVLSNNAGLPP